jgi:hypothetical protein
VKVKWYIFVKSVGSSDSAILLQGEENSTIPALGVAKVESKTASVTFKPAYQNKKERVKAEGEKFDGYGVQVYEGEALIGQVFNPEGNKAKVAK